MKDTESKTPAQYVCVNANCGRTATHARVLDSCVQPVCESCARWMKRYGSTVVPLDEAIAQARD